MVRVYQSRSTISWQIHRVLYSGIRLVMADLWRFLVAMLSRFLFIFTQVTKAQPTSIVKQCDIEIENT